MASTALASTGRVTRARSKEADSTPTSPTKRPSRPRKGKVSGLTEQEQQLPRTGDMNLLGAQLPTVPEEAPEDPEEQLRNNVENLQNLATSAANFEPNPATGQMPANVDQPPEFSGAPIGTIRSVRGRARGGRGKGGRPRKQPSTTQDVAPVAHMSSNQGPPSAQEMNVPIVDPQLEQAHQQPKRSIYDSQPGAQRITFDSQDEPPPNPFHPRPLHGEVIATQDEGFQAEDRPAQPRRPRTKKPRASENEFQPNTDDGAEDRAPSPPRDPPPPSNYAQVQQQAKLFTSTLRKDKVPQKRKAWTLDECDALIDGIGHFGNGYAALKADDSKHRGLLHDRSAEDLRHKARNMKFDYLKAGIALPEGFDAVLLDKKFQDKLSAMGRDYSQVQMRQAKRTKTHAGQGSSQDEGEESSQIMHEA